MSKAEAKAGINWKKFCKAILLGTLSGLVLAILLLLLLSWGISEGSAAPGQGSGGVIIISGLAAFAGTLIASAAVDMRGLLLGLSVGLAMGVIQLLMGVVLSDEFILNMEKLAVVCSTVVGGGAAGALCGRKKKKVQKKRRNIR